MQYLFLAFTMNGACLSANNAFWRFDVNNKADAFARAQETGVGFDEDDNERPEILRKMFDDWCIQFPVECTATNAFPNFVNNMREVRRINMDENLPYWASGNQFSHLSENEFQNLFTGAQINPRHLSRKLLARNRTKNISPNPSPNPSPTPAPDVYAVNWVSRGMVTPIKNQGPCGSCWAFAATALVESIYLISGRGSFDLSEQQFVSCMNSENSPYPSFGCSGGYAHYAISYAAYSPIDIENIWPYTAANDVCNQGLIATLASGNAKQLSSGSVQVYPSNSESALKSALTIMPTVVLFMVDGTFQSYAGGIYKPSSCTTNVNHGMLAVGYGTDATNQGFWIVKNSWSTNWGEQGFVRVAMTGDGPGPCGMYQYAYQGGSAM